MNVISSGFHPNQATVAGHGHGVQPRRQEHPTRGNGLCISDNVHSMYDYNYVYLHIYNDYYYILVNYLSIAI